jgi:hypothetical protein
MLGSAVLEIVIGLSFIYLLFSLLCSSINEWFARWRNWRGQELRLGINKLLADPDESGLARAVQQHPLIKGLEQGGRYPSYIASSTFALALMEIAIEFQTPITNTIPEPKIKTTIKDNRNNTLTFTNEQQALVRSLSQGATSAFSLASIIERWFDSSMERVSGTYKRKTQLSIVLIACAVAVLCNVDTVRIARELNRNGTLRTVLVKRAQGVIDKTSDPNSIKPAEELAALQLPLGWGSFAHIWDAIGRACSEPSLLVAKLFGLLISCLALSLGAPFWFDLLSKLVNLRQTGVPPDETNSVSAQ